MPQLALDQWTLGDLIDALECRPVDQLVVFDFCRLAPHGMDSYRGFYEDLALSFRPGAEYEVGTMLTVLRESVGRTFYGYKGGEYRAARTTALWVANHGETSETIIVGIEDDEHQTVLRTRWLGH